MASSTEFIFDWSILGFVLFPFFWKRLTTIIPISKLKNNKKVGKVYYDVNTGEAKIYNKKTDGTYGFQVIDIETYVKPDAPKGSTQEEKDAEISKRFEILSDDQRRIIEDIRKNKPDDFGTGA